MIEAAFAQTTHTDLLTALVAVLRPRKTSDYAETSSNLDQLTQWLHDHTNERQRVSEAIRSLISTSDLQYIFSESGMQTGSSFLSELGQKISRKFLPELLPANDLRLPVQKIFWKKTDYHWINSIQESSWLHFFECIHPAIDFDNKSQTMQLIEAAETLSFRIAALGLDKRINAIVCSNNTAHQNAFVEQNKEWQRYRQLAETGRLQQDSLHAFGRMEQWFDIGHRQIRRIRKLKRDNGTSLQQTFIVERLEQYLLRLRTILTILDPGVDVSAQQYSRYFKEVVENENTHNRIRPFLSQNISQLAYLISEHGSRTGEKYISNNRKEYRQFFRSAAIGGFIITLAALVKLGLTALHLPYFWASFSYGFNYALAFVFIHFLHGTIATKQPALTASSIAHALDSSSSKSASLQNMAGMIAKVMSSQLGSLTGNLIVVLPLSILMAMGFHSLTGAHLLPPEEIEKTFATVTPHIANIWYAAIAGVLLFASGIISGYFDNLVIYGNIPQRMLRSKRLHRMLGEKKLQTTAKYIDKNLGAIMGNIALGFGLGFMIFFGKILGLPLDIRHVTISTGFFGFSWVASGFQITSTMVLWCFLGLACIAATNLFVSFSLALFTALKSRKVHTKDLWPLLKITLRLFIRKPGAFLLPPRREKKLERLAEAT